MINPSSIYLSYILSLIPNLLGFLDINISKDKVIITVNTQIDELDSNCITESLDILHKYSKIKSYSFTRVGNKSYLEFTI